MKKVIKIINFINDYIWYPIVDGFTSVYENTKYVFVCTTIIVLIVIIAIRILKDIGM